MSSELGQAFAADYHEKYAEVVEKWAGKLDDGEFSAETAEKWGADLNEALGEAVIEALTSKEARSLWSSKGVKLPSKETLGRFSQIAAKYTLQYASHDLLARLAKSAKFDKENPPEDAVTAAIRPMRPSELAKRSPQTVAQIFDMAKDKYNDVLARYLTKDEQFTGRRRWETEGKDSRHASLNNKIAGPEDFFKFNKEEIALPRPVGGDPADWSNCSCSVSYETKKGKWIKG